MKDETCCESTVFPGAKLKKRPNIVLIVTDQQREVMHWPKGLAKQLMPSMTRLQNNGITFTNNYTAATSCSPSRASVFTGVYPSVHGVKALPPDPGMSDEITNIFKLMQNADYEVAYKGKMHLFTPKGNPSTDDFTSYDIEWASDHYGANRWNPPDDSIDAHPSVHMAGGWPNNDLRYVSGVPHTTNRMTPAVGKDESILEYLDDYAARKKSSKSGSKVNPFFLVCSFGNPHDISIWPYQNEWGYNAEEYKMNDELPLLNEIELPSSHDDDLKDKPIGQTKIKQICDMMFPCDARPDTSRVDYCKFYAYLHSVVDKHISTVLDKLDEHELTDDTIIFRFADHGEQAFAHGMQQKSVNGYEESIKVPLIVSNPILFKKKTTTSSFSSLIDLVPTIAELTGATTPRTLKSQGVNGKSLVPIMNKPDAAVRDNIMFYSEDVKDLFKKKLNEDFTTIPGKIRSIRCEGWMYAVYFTDNGSQFQYELYDMENDPNQNTNLAWGVENQKKYLPRMQELHDRLTTELEIYNALPKGFPWPKIAGTTHV